MGHFINIMINRFIEYLPTSPADQSKIWVPYTIFFNIESQKKIKHSDKKEVMKVVPNPDNYYTLPDAVNSSQMTKSTLSNSPCSLLTRTHTYTMAKTIL